MKLINQTLTVLFALAFVISLSGFADGMFGLAGLIARMLMFGVLTVIFASLS